MAKQVASKPKASFRKALARVRKAVVEEADLAGSEWASLTKHIGETIVIDSIGLLKCESNDAIVDAVKPIGAEDRYEFDDTSEADRKTLTERGIQVKSGRNTTGQTGNVKLKSPFAELYVVILDKKYCLKEAYRLTRDQVVTLIQVSTAGDDNNHKIQFSSLRAGTGTNVTSELKDIAPP